MKIRTILADTGRAHGSAASLLNAGWSFTTAAPLPPPLAGWTLPQQALAVFLECPWDQLNQPLEMTARLVDDDGKAAYFSPGPTAPDGTPGREVVITQLIAIPPIPGAPNGTPGQMMFLFDIAAGALWISAARHRYLWKVSVGSDDDEIGFWVNAPASAPMIGGLSFPISPGQ